MGHQRPQAVHHQRLRREALRRLCDDQPGAGITRARRAFLVPRDTPGLTVARCNETMGGRFMNNGEIVFEDCAVPTDHVPRAGRRDDQGGRLFPPGQDHRRPRRISASVSPPSSARRSTFRITCRAAASSSSTRPSRCGSRTWRRGRGGALAARTRPRGGRDRRRRCRCTVQHGEDVCVRGNPEGLPARNGAARRQRRHARFRRREVASRCGTLSAPDATVDISRFKIVKAMFPQTAGKYAGPEN